MRGGELDATDFDDDDDTDDAEEDAAADVSVSNTGSSSKDAAPTTESHACTHASFESTPRKCASITKSEVATAPASGTMR